MLYFVLSSLSIFLNSKTNVVTNLDLRNSDIKSSSLFLTADSISLNCSSEIKKLKLSTLQVLPQV